MKPEEMFNKTIQIWKERDGLNTNEISDGYHTFGDLYKARHHLFISLCKQLDFFNHIKIYNPLGKSQDFTIKVIRSKIHNDGLDVWHQWGMFLLCIHGQQGQISFHIPNEYWNECDFAITEEQATIPFDGHTSEDVLERLLRI